ncbi:MAG: TIGR03564 family F420-dependent LLM class oxidoreductase [Acidimicrobiales bacterium]
MRVSLFHFISWGVVPATPIAAVSGTSPVEDYIEQLRKARSDGFTMVWTPQLWREPDLLTLLALALHEVEDITVGTGVIPIQFRHPAVLAQQALTVNLISGGRLKLGIGMTHPMISEGMYGVPWGRHTQRLNEFLDGLLPLLHGEEAKATGDITSTRLVLDIPGVGPPPVYMAALGPRMLDITARRMAGTMTWMTGPRTLANHVIPTLERCSQQQGQRAEVVAAFPICVTDRPEEARTLAAQVFEIYGAQPSYRAMLNREGYEGPGDAAIIGNEETVSQQLEAVAALGVEELSAFVFARTPEEDARTRTLLGSMARSGEAG